MNYMNRRAFIGSLAAAAAGGLRGAETRPPNIVFILADDLGWGDLGCYGHRDIQTPNLDRVAKQGALFTNFYVNGSVCSPSRSAFTTGQYPARNRIHGHFADDEMNTRRDMPQWLDPAVATLPRVLKQAGYRTGHFGKWHLGHSNTAPPPSAYGLDESRTVNSTGPGWKDENDGFFRARSSELIVDETLRFIRESAGKPFYVNVWSLVPHATLDPTPEQLKPYARFNPGTPRHKGATAIFYASVTALDTAVGRLLQGLEEMKLADNTIVLFSSDNGPEDIHVRNASHSGVGSAGVFRGRKRSLYEGGIRAPFLVRWPGHVRAGRVDDESVLCGADFLPTLSRLAGATIPKGHALDGEDVSDILTGKSRARTKPLNWEWRFNITGDVVNRSPILAIRDGNWKLLLNPDRSRVELYDLPRDPGERQNLAAAHKDVVERLAARALAWQKTLPPGRIEPTAGRADYPWPKEGR